jgi:DNA-binding transcriptional ArsR family regulator
MATTATRARKSARSSAPARDDVVVLTDARAIRALAHPARVAVVTALYAEGTALTATRAAEIAGLTPSAMSYHLRALERAGIVARADVGGDGRERPWVRAGTDLVVNVDEPGTAASLAATSVLIDAAFDSDRQDLKAVLARRGTVAERPLDEATVFSRHALRLTPAEAKRLQKDLAALLATFDERTRESAPRGAGLVNLTILAVAPERPRHDDGR